MMELDDFISSALTAIVWGIKKGQSTDVGDHIAPLIQGKQRNERGNFHLKDDDSNQATIVEFDVQVTSGTESKIGGTGQGKFKLFVVEAKAGGGGEQSEKISHVHRLQFAIPIKIPTRVSAA